MVKPRWARASGIRALLLLLSRLSLARAQLSADQQAAELENLTNRTYRTHGSGIDAAGTNVTVGVDWVF